MMCTVVPSKVTLHLMMMMMMMMMMIMRLSQATPTGHKQNTNHTYYWAFYRHKVVELLCTLCLWEDDLYALGLGQLWRNVEFFTFQIPK